jgi:hypothetical protein
MNIPLGQQEIGSNKLPFGRLSRSHRAGTPPLATVDEWLKTVPSEEKRKVGRVGSFIFVSILLLLTAAIIVVNYIGFRKNHIDTISSQSKPPVQAANK